VDGPLISGDALARLVGGTGDVDVVVADVRWYLDGRSGRAAYEAGHVPGAVFVSLDDVLAGPVGSGPGRHPLPDAGAFASAMGALGIGDDTFVVAYDDTGGATAARLWWMLHVLGHRRAAVLDGGLAAWPGPLETGAGADVARAPATFTVRPWPADALVDADGVAARAPGTVVLDARAGERYRGEVEPVDPHPGHVPGALSAPWSENLDAATGRFLPAEALRSRFAALGVVDDATEVVCYCGSGVTACHDLLALEVAGVGGKAARLYEGSWSDWSSQPSRPRATGPSPA
jgi:thiosulfate/3-mercaptopyruvate sulfurtransferase